MKLLLLLSILLTNYTYSLQRIQQTNYQRPFMAVNVNAGMGASPLQVGSQKSKVTLLEAAVIPEFYLGKANHPVYFYMQSPLTGTFFPKYTGYQMFSVGFLVGIGGYLKEATTGTDNLSITLNGAVGTNFYISYHILHEIYLASYASLNFRHHIDIYYGIQYGMYMEYQTTIEKHVISGGFYIGFAFNNIYD